MYIAMDEGCVYAACSWVLATTTKSSSSLFHWLDLVSDILRAMCSSQVRSTLCSICAKSQPMHMIYIYT